MNAKMFDSAIVACLANVAFSTDTAENSCKPVLFRLGSKHSYPQKKYTMKPKAHLNISLACVLPVCDLNSVKEFLIVKTHKHLIEPLR